MCDIDLRFRCPDEFSEVLSEDPEQAEIVLEDLVSQALLQIFDTVLVEEVTIRFSQLKSE